MPDPLVRRTDPMPFGPPAAAASGRDRILIVDDDPGSVQVFGRIVAPLGEVRFALSGQEGLRIARESGVDLVLLDAELPDLSGIEVCRQMRADPLLADVPVICITSHRDLDHELGALEAGAVDFIGKPPRAPLVQARVRTHLRLKHLTDALRHTATIDHLTGVANRNQFDARLASEWLRAARSGTWLSLLMVDVDHFKRYNDRYGHPAGDMCLRQVAQALRSAAHRPADHVARYGGEEFAVLLPDTDPAGARRIAQRVLDGVAALRLPHDDSPTRGTVSVSIGVASSQPVSLAAPLEAGDRSLGMAWLVGDADRALYAAKHGGRACYQQAGLSSVEPAPFAAQDLAG